MTCPFCALPAAQKIAEDALTLTLRDAFPVSPGHTLVVTRRHVASWFDATADEQRAILQAVASAKTALDAEHHPDGYNLGLNDGAAAGQTVFHLHMHVIPRYAGDTPNPRGGVRNCIPAHANPLLARAAAWTLQREYELPAHRCAECEFFSPLMAMGGEVLCGHDPACRTGALCDDLRRAGHRWP